ncbi:MAG TPA: glycosyltransferase family 1 protein [Byssovorax sp.]|jgi:glycosyltransferase involved in cell wall biosynthesis
MHEVKRVAAWVAGGDGGASGLGVYFREMLPRIAELLAGRGVETLFLGTGVELEAAGVLGASAVVLPPVFDKTGLAAAAAIALGAVIAERHGARALYLPAANRRTALSTSLPLVGTVHDLAQLAPGGRFGALRDTYVRRVVAPSLRRMVKVLAISDATKKDVVEKVGVDAARVRVVPNGVRFHPAGRANPRTKPYLLYPARLEHPAKNHVRLLEAFAGSSLAKTHDLVLTGKDWGAGALIDETARRLGVAERVDALGFVTDDALAALLEHADIGVAAGVCEGFGLPAAEALAMGRPVVFAKAGALPEVVGDLGAGFEPHSTSDLKAALERAAHDDLLRARCATLGPKRAARYSWDDAALVTADAIHEAARAAA